MSQLRSAPFWILTGAALILLLVGVYFFWSLGVSSASKPSNPSNPSNPRTSNAQSVGFSEIGDDVIRANADSIWFILPDYTGPMHNPQPKCDDVDPAQLSDFSAAGYVLGLLSNAQKQILDTDSSISQTDCGNPVGTGTTLVALAGPSVNKVVHYYEQVSASTPVYFLLDGSERNFVVRASGQRYTVPNEASNPVAGDDLFLLEAFTFKDKNVFILYGFSWQGTLAAGVFYASYMHPQLSQFPNAWYIYRWTDGSGNGSNTFPDASDTYTLIASSNAAPSLTSSNVPSSGSRYPGFAGILTDVLNASQGSVYFILPDYLGPMHSPAAKCGGVNPALLSDYSALGYILSATSNFQNQVLDTGGFVSTSNQTCGQFAGSASVLVAFDGPGVNTAVYYYENMTATSPVYFLQEGERNSFVVRATGQKYDVPNAASNPASGDDLFLLETFKAEGRRVYVMYGFTWQGTFAAATFLNTHVRSHFSEFTNDWFIYEWKDATSGTSANSFPDQGDSYIEIAKG